MYHTSMADRTACSVHELLENLLTQQICTSMQQCIKAKMYNSIVSFTSPISICLRIVIIKLQFGESCPYVK